jgi:hypothetical protein
VFGSIEEIALSCNAWVPYWLGCKLHDQVNKLLTFDVGFGEFWFVSTSFTKMGNITSFNWLKFLLDLYAFLKPLFLFLSLFMNLLKMWLFVKFFFREN